MLRYHPDGWVFLGDFRATRDEFQAAYPDWQVPRSVYGEYDGRRHVLRDADGNQFAGPVPWPTGDDVLAQAEAIQAAVLAGRRLREPPQTPDPRLPDAPPQTPDRAVVRAQLARLPDAQVIDLCRDLLADWIARNPAWGRDGGLGVYGDCQAVQTFLD